MSERVVRLSELGIALDLHLVREQELHEVDRVVDALDALRDDDQVAADERGRRARLDAGKQGDAELHVGILRRGRG